MVAQCPPRVSGAGLAPCRYCRPCYEERYRTCTHIYCFDWPTCIPYKPDVRVALRAPCPPCVRPKLAGCNTILKSL
eukprot:119462-Chlamydomonas_euryale.AAC.1